MDPVQDKTKIKTDTSSPSTKATDLPSIKDPLPPIDTPDDLVAPGSISDAEEKSPQQDSKDSDNMPSKEPASLSLKPTSSPSTKSVGQPPDDKPKLDDKNETEEGLKPAMPPSDDQSTNLKSKDKILLLAGPLFLIASLGVSAFIVNTQQTAQPTQFPVEQATTPPTPSEADTPLGESGTWGVEKLQYILENSPQNPTAVTVTCQSTGETLVSKTPTDCPDPLFTWSGEYSKEPGTEISAYYVYFGTNGNDSPISLKSTIHELGGVMQPFKDGVHQIENYFPPEDLIKGTTYYFAVSAESNTENPDIRLGLDPVSIDPPEARSAKILFTYIYE